MIAARAISLIRDLFSADHQRGQNLPEFAFASLTFFLLFIGTIEFGQALFTYDLVANAARLGTRYAIVRGSACTTAGCPATSATIQTYVRGASQGINTANLTVSTTWPSTAATNGCSSPVGASPVNGPGCLVHVSVSYPFTFAAFGFRAITMTSVSQMIISQ